MRSPLVDAFRHSAWANRELLQFCRGLTDEQLRATAVGTYGNMHETLWHLIEAEFYYRFLVTGNVSDWYWDRESPPLDDLELWAGKLAASWEALLDQGVDADAVLIQIDSEGHRHKEVAGIVLAQTLHHANVHREQICTILTSLGIEPPDLDVWSYGISIGKHV